MSQRAAAVSPPVVLDDGAAFTGDLTHPDMVGLEHAAVVAASWSSTAITS